jgi:hypothetical protein
VGWSVSGIVAAGIIAAFAYYRSRAPGGFYDADIYGMTRRTHLAYAGISLVFCAAFLSCILLHRGMIALWVLTAFVLFALFYLTSFLRGAHEDDG